MEKRNKRAKLGARVGAILVAAGSSVGLGNIWRFPYIAGENGGGAFLLINICCVLILGLPILISEFAIGRNSRRSVVGAYGSYGKWWGLVGYNSLFTTFLIMGFYFVVAGWTLQYFVSSASGELATFSNAAEYGSFFKNIVSTPLRPIIFALTFIAATHAVIAFGVQKGIEKCSKILMPVLFVALLILSINSILMPGAAEGLKFLFYPDFSKVTPQTILVAMGQAFFSLSVGLGCMTTYGSYFDKKTNIRTTALNVTILDTLVAILAGVVIFPAVFTAGITPTEGPSLVFVTLPAIFNSMPLSSLWSSIFFVLLIVAALTSTISLHEMATSYFHEEWKLSRTAGAWLTSTIVAALSIAASLSLGVWGGWKIGSLNFFDSLDFVTANIMLPISGMAISIFAGWFFSRQRMEKETTNDGELRMRWMGLLLFLLRWVCPLLLLILFIYNLWF